MGSNPTSEEKEMTFWEHLDELRGTLFRIIIAVVVCSIVAFVFKGILFDHILLAPKDPDFITYRVFCKLGEWLGISSLCVDPSQFELININLAGQFMSHMNISLVAGLIASMPYILWELWRFVRPGPHRQGTLQHTRGGRVTFPSCSLQDALFLLHRRTADDQFPRGIPGQRIGDQPDRPDLLHQLHHHDDPADGIAVRTPGARGLPDKSRDPDSHDPAKSTGNTRPLSS